MTLIPTTIQHFTHKQHPLILHDDTINPKYLCEGCMTYGFGTRYHCHACTFNLHEYCATCPRIIRSFMHPNHPLRLVERDHLSGDRACNICCGLIEGLSYRCELCGFDVHPICTQLPETLKHILHQRHHPLRLLSSVDPGITCAVCRGACNPSSWRYRCALCKFDIHIGCVPIQCQNTTTHRGIRTYIPPPILPQQHYFVGYPSPNHFPGPSNMNHYNYNIMPQYPQLYQQNQGHGQAQTHYSGNYGGRTSQVMFNLVKAIATGVISNVIFGVDVSPFFGF
ncbi:hypothetical protein H5410_044266 [Solanum commersonii]|uniref:DC1 domain-containing protein n=1 Tax=Solanum commersonii TaxID=4109 RepID=A0A9J5XAC9_SOLCO|nr:hypothetical protein H5410_044266 [Solanum commersonii]